MVRPFGATKRIALRRGMAFVDFATADAAAACVEAWTKKQGTGAFIVHDREIFIAPQKSKVKMSDAESEAKLSAVATAKYARKKKRRRAKRTGAFSVFVNIILSYCFILLCDLILHSYIAVF